MIACDTYSVPKETTLQIYFMIRKWYRLSPLKKFIWCKKNIFHDIIASSVPSPTRAYCFVRLRMCFSIIIYLHNRCTVMHTSMSLYWYLLIKISKTENNTIKNKIIIPHCIILSKTYYNNNFKQRIRSYYSKFKIIKSKTT